MIRLIFTGLFILATVVSVLGRILDDFDAVEKGGWDDFTFGMGSTSKSWGTYVISVPAGLARQPFFVASTKQDQTFAVLDGQTLEMRVDLVNAAGQDIFAVLAWIPEGEAVSAFTGYFIAKSEREVCIGKAVHKYFHKAQPDPPIKNYDVTLVLCLTGDGDNVIVNARILDKADGSVLFEGTYVDTPGVDAFDSGTDIAGKPFAGEGRFTLMGYSEAGDDSEDVCQVFFDNTWVSTPAPAALAPVIYGYYPPQGASFVTWTNIIVSFYVTDDERWDILDSGTMVEDSMVGGIAIGYKDIIHHRTVWVIAPLEFHTDKEYSVTLLAIDRHSASNSVPLRFDTFDQSHPVIEVEDYDFGGGNFWDAPGLIPEGYGPWTNAYSQRVGIPGTDFYDTQASASSSLYRPDDPVGIKRSIDYYRPKFTQAGGRYMNIFDYDVHEIVAGEYLNYTRTFPEGYYYVYLREALINVEKAEAVLEFVSPGSQPNRFVLGHFFGKQSGFEYRNVPLTGSSGRRTAVYFSGVTTCRLSQKTSAPSDGAIYQNYMVFVPVTGPGVLVESAEDVDGPYDVEMGAAVEISGRTITVARPADATRFYRLKSESASKITSIRLEGDKLRLGF